MRRHLAGILFFCWVIAAVGDASAELKLTSSATFNSGVAGSSDTAYAVSADPSDNIYVAGSVQGSGSTIWAAKYSSSLNLLSSATFESASNDSAAYGAALDLSKNWILAGYVNETGTRELWVGKYNSSLVLLSSATSPGAGVEGAGYGVSVNGDTGDIYVTGSVKEGSDSVLWVGRFDENLVFLSSTSVSGAGAAADTGKGIALDTLGNVVVSGSLDADADFFLAKYDPSLGLISSGTFGSGQIRTELVSGVAVGGGHLYASGFVVSSSSDIWLGKFSSSLALVSSVTFNDAWNGADYAEGIRVDGSGYVYVAGVAYASHANPDVWVARLDPNLVLMTSSTFNGAGNGEDRGYGVAVLSARDVVVAGRVVESGGTDVWVGRFSADTTGSIPVPGAAPDNFQGTALSTSSIRWSWDGVTDATGYYLYLSSDSGFQTCDIVWLPGLESTSFKQEGLGRYSIHFAEVSAYNMGGEGPKTSVVDATTLRVGPTEVFSNETLVKTFNLSSGTLRVTVATGTFSQTVYLGVVDRDPSRYDAASPVAVFAPPLQVFDLDAGGSQPTQPVAFELCYETATLPSGTDERRLTLAFRQSSGWLPLPTAVNTSSHCAAAEAHHFSLFGLFLKQQASGSAEAAAWPSPFHVGRPGYIALNLSKLAPRASVRIFTVSGERVRSLIADSVGEAKWDIRNDSGAQVASGVYLILIEGTGGKKILKVGVQR